MDIHLGENEHLNYKGDNFHVGMIFTQTTLQQFDPHGNLLHKLSTRLGVSCYGEAELVSLIQT